MFVCPNTRLTLSMGIPFESANVANECRLQWRRTWGQILFTIY